MPLRIVLFGADGRMGRAIRALAERDQRFELGTGISRSNPTELGAGLDAADVLVDFSSPEGSLEAVAQAAKHKVPAVVGTTGFAPTEFSRLKAYSHQIALFVSPNMSPGMNLLIYLAQEASSALKTYDAAITETHHTRKKDAPSGSAKSLGESVRRGRGETPPIASLRAGDIVGEHTLLLAGPGESLTFTHRAHSREVFARGALEAALWVRGKKPGLYTMRDLLGLKPA